MSLLQALTKRVCSTVQETSTGKCLQGNMAFKIANVPFPFQSAPSNGRVLIPSGAKHTKRNIKDASQLVYVIKLHIQTKS